MAAVTSSQSIRTSESLHTLDDESILDVDEPPDSSQIMFKRLPIRSPNLSSTTNSMDDGIDRSKKQSLLTQGLSYEARQTAHQPRSAISSYSNDSMVSMAELTSDGGLTSPARTSTPSPPVPPTTLNFKDPSILLKRIETTMLVAAEPQRKRCITFACGKPPLKVEEAKEKKEETPQIKKAFTIKFACHAKPEDTSLVGTPHVSSHMKIERAEDDFTPKKSVSRLSLSRSPTIMKKKQQPCEALRFHEFATRHLEEDEWVNEKPRRQSKLTVSDTLRKENEYRKLGEEAAAEALEAEREEDEEAMKAGYDEDNDDEDLEGDDDDEVDDDDDDDEEVETDGNESDNEAGFAESDDDDENEENSDYQFWTTGHTTAATSTDHVDHIHFRPRSVSASSIDSVIATGNGNNAISHPDVKKRQRRLRPKMRPLTPELPDSTDFVCGTLDEDRPLEAAYLACVAQRKLEKHGIIPQDLDPSFPTSDPEQYGSDEEDEEESLDSHDDTWAAGRFDDFEVKTHLRGRPNTKTRSPSISPKRVKSPCPQLLRNKVMAHTPPPTRRLFGQSPKGRRPPAPRHQPISPPTSRLPSYEDKSVNIPRLAQRPHLTHTKSLPRTPNPFWREHCRQRKQHAAVPDDGDDDDLDDDLDVEILSRGPIDIIQGLENKRRRRKEKFWITHCRKEAKEKEKDRRRQPPGRGAKRMRELGLEAADRCKGYGQRLQLVLSI